MLLHERGKFPVVGEIQNRRNLNESTSKPSAVHSVQRHKLKEISRNALPATGETVIEEMTDLQREFLRPAKVFPINSCTCVFTGVYGSFWRTHNPMVSGSNPGGPTLVIRRSQSQRSVSSALRVGFFAGGQTPIGVHRQRDTRMSHHRLDHLQKKCGLRWNEVLAWDCPPFSVSTARISP